MHPLPASKEIELQHSCGNVTAIALDPNGSRLVTGGFNSELKFWNFERMDPSLKSFKSLQSFPNRSVQPFGPPFIKNIEFCPTGNSVLIVGCEAHAKVLNRNGLEQFACPKGDWCLSDMAKTKGHCAMLNYGCWHPHNSGEFLTCSDDETLRIWVIDEKTVQKQVIKPRQMSGLRALPTSCQYNRNGQLVTAACWDGSIQMWDPRKNFLYTALMVSGAHAGRPYSITSIAFSYSNTYLASKGIDGTLKLWDLRKFKDPIHSANNLFSICPTTNCCFSPADDYVLTGLSLGMNDRVGKVVFFDRNSFSKVNELKAGNSEVIRTMWHPKLNQIIASNMSGAVKIFYDPNLSYRGAKLFVTETKKKSKDMEMIWEHQITSPRALPTFRVNPPISSKKQFEKDPLESRWPDLPVAGPGHAGQIASDSNTLSSFTVGMLEVTKKVDDNINPSDAILTPFKEVEDTPLLNPANIKNQPTLEVSLEDNMNEPPKKRAKF